MKDAFIKVVSKNLKVDKSHLFKKLTTVILHYNLKQV
jgi:hypothetical protein